MFPAVAHSSLAIHGETPVRSAPFPIWPCFGEDEIAAAAEVMRSGCLNYWTGTEGSSFEREFARATGCAHAVALANGTIALELALRAIGIGSGRRCNYLEHPNRR